MVKIILLQNVPRVGQKYEVKEVSAGYAANFLYPRKLAEQATTAKVAELAKKKDAAGAAALRHTASIAEAIKALDGTTIPMTVKADGKDHLFKKLRSEDIAKMLPKIGEKDFPDEAVIIKEPIKTLGEHAVDLTSGNIKARFTLSVGRE